MVTAAGWNLRCSLSPLAVGLISSHWCWSYQTVSSYCKRSSIFFYFFFITTAEAARGLSMRWDATWSRGWRRRNSWEEEVQVKWGRWEGGECKRGGGAGGSMKHASVWPPSHDVQPRFFFFLFLWTNFIHNLWVAICRIGAEWTRVPAQRSRVIFFEDYAHLILSSTL